MATDVIMPALGMAQDTGILVSWLRREGEEVAKGDPLMEVETDKAVVEVEAPAAGILAAVSAAEGDEVPVGQVIALILAPGEEAPSPSEREMPRKPPAQAAAAEAPAAGEAAPRAATEPGAAPPVRDERLPAASPKARRMAAERGLEVRTIHGSGPEGAVLAADVPAEAAVEGARPGGAPASPLETGRLWRVMAERTSQSWAAAPHFYLTRQVDATRLVGWRQSLRRQGIEVTFSDLLVRVAAAALTAHPRVNARWEDGVVAQEGVNIGLAVATVDGLVAPVLHGSDRLGLEEIASRRGELVGRAREGRLTPADLTGGGFTISNLGMYGVDAFSAILNAGQAAILAVGRIADRVVAVAGRPEVRPVMILTLSCDHRVIDGARGAEFLQTLADLLEEPAGLVR